MNYLRWAGPDGGKLEAQSLTVQRGGRRLFHDLNLSLEPGQLALITGPNGSGKTSLLRCLVGFLPPEQGQVIWPLVGPEEIAWEGHALGLKPELTVADNLAFTAQLSDHCEPMDTAALGLTGLEHRQVASLSAGQRRRVGLVRLGACGRPAWVMDEPYTNLDNAGRQIVNEMIRSHLSNGGMAVVAAHQPPTFSDLPVQALQLGDAAVV